VIRLFAAIAIPGDVAQTLARCQGGLPGVRWRPVESLHITLRFVGETPENQADDLDGELSRVIAQPFGVRIAGVGTFGEGDDIDALWAGVDGGEPLARLASRCETAARRAGLKPETRRWRPHVTLAYVRRIDPLSVATWVQAHSLLTVAPFTISRFGLYSSWRGEDGAVYRLERSYPLG